VVEALLDALKYEIPDYFSGDTIRGSSTSHDLAIKGLEAEGDTNTVTVSACDL
jgi:hypothetical protein